MNPLLNPPPEVGPCECKYCKDNPRQLTLPIMAQDAHVEEMADLFTKAVFIQQTLNRGQIPT